VARVKVGISGWTYDGWRRAFYPEGLPRRLELAHVAERLGSVEINGSFYSLQRPTSWTRWRSETPESFVFAVKGGRYITHVRRLRDVEVPLATFLASGVLALGPKLGPLLWQLPPQLAYDEARLTAFLELLPRTTGAALELARRFDPERLKPDRVLIETDADRPLRHAVEVRHPSFAAAEPIALLRRHDVALVVADSAGKWPHLEEVTSSFVYVRLHGAEELYTSGYTDAALDEWAIKIAAWRDAGLDVFVYFDNDVKVRAPYDAMALAARLDAS
jgi:uncharacterized protein YecE (DUF72 family)